jgi:hypothetical protein
VVVALVMGITQQPFSQVVRVVAVLEEKEIQLKQQQELPILEAVEVETDFLAAQTAALASSSSKYQTLHTLHFQAA